MKERTITRQMQNTTLLVSLVIILCVQGALLTAITLTISSNLKERANRTAEETVAFLRDPLYNLDDNQAVKIGEALLSSGFIARIRIDSTATGIVFDSGNTAKTSSFNPVTREIRYNDLLLGTVFLTFANREVTEVFMFMLLFSLVVLITVFVATLYVHQFVISKKISEPFDTLIDGLARIADGDFATRFGSTGFTDLNLLSCGINDMAEKIQTKKRELVDLNNSLEQRVRERTDELQRSIEELHKTQDRLIKSEKLTALGHLSAGIAHELNTPLGAIIASNRQIEDFFDNRHSGYSDFLLRLDLPGIDLFKYLLSEGLKATGNIDKGSPEQKIIGELEAELEWENIANSEKLAELLAEIGISGLNNELLFLLNHPQNLTIAERASDIIITRKMVRIISIAGQKAATVVTALRSYLTTEPDDEFQKIDLNDNIERILTLMHNMLHQGVIVKREFSTARVIGSADKLGQIWMNLIRNALEAMSFNGTLTIRTGTRDHIVRVEIEDTGPGIPEEIHQRLFEPFFSTKQNSGMGLGLEICKRIIEQHQGSIRFETQPGRTVFIVEFPSAEEHQ